MANDVNDSKGPWWAKTLWVVGPITFIALGLVYFITQSLREDIRMIRQGVVTQSQQLQDHQQHTEALHQNIESYMRIQTLLTRQLCVNAARTVDDRNACFKP